MGTGIETLSPAHRVRQLAADLLATPVGRELVTRFRATRLDLLILLGLTVLAAVPRLVLLTDIPPGFHGDEAWTGIDARRVLDEGWIGPYVISALGQPAGPLYFAAPIVGLLGDSVFSVRLSMALLAIVTVPVAYLTFRVMFGRTLGTFAAILLALGLWHLHFSRIGFMVISWPLMELVTLLFLFLGIKTRRWLFFGLAGLAFGAGIYTYNAYPIFALPFGVFIVWLALRYRGRDLMRYGGQVTLMAGLAIFAALPMILYATEPGRDLLIHHRGVSLLETEEWESGGLVDKGQLVFERTSDFFTSAFWDGRTDGADGSGEEAMVDRVTVVLLILGTAMFLRRWRQPAAVAVLLMVILLPAASIFSINAMFRRTLGIVPFLAVLAAAPLAFWWDQAKTFKLPWRNASYAAIAIVVALIGYLNLSFYFNEFPDTENTRFTFVEELADASQYLSDLPGDPYVYFYSGRWSFNYETRRYLASNREGEDRSEEHGTFSLEPDRGGDVVYVFLAPYLEQADEVERRFPGGTRFDSVEGDGRVLFRAYFLPDAGRFVTNDRTPNDAATPGPSTTPTIRPTVTAEAGIDERDVIRVQDLAAIRDALEEYREANGSYPDSGGAIQSLCVFPDLDIGCALRDVLDPLPQDPLGEPAINGYWYVSTGSEYIVYARRESGLVPECAEHPDHLGAIDSLLCVQGP